ncbi:MAG TPA: hypothetical protein VGP68_12850 [Gemmataceae bacterium]|nr:hypothetical protein [Gemmataceae bacterium]
MTKALTILIGGTIAVWAAAFLPARLLGGERTLVYSLVALLICLIPSAFTLAWACRTIKYRPSQAFVVIASGTGVRVTFVLGAGLILNQAVTYFEQTSFWLWILGFYMVTLCLETLLMRGLKSAASA